MMHRIFLSTWIVVFALYLPACATPTEADPELMDAVNEATGESEEESDEIAEESSDEAPSEEVAGNDESLDGDLESEEEELEAPPAEEQATNEEENLEELTDDLGSGSQEQAATEESFDAEMAQDTPVESPPPGISTQITNIEYLANQNGGTVVIRTNGAPEYTTRTNGENGQFVVEIKNSTLPEKLKRPFIMKDFKGAFGAVNAYQNPGSSTVRIVLEQKSAGSPTVQLEGNSLIVIPNSSPVQTEVVADADQGYTAPELPEEVRPANPVQTLAEEEKILAARTLDEFLMGNNRFFGKEISIEFSKDADVRDVINFIAEESGVNIVMSEEVKGNLSVKLRRVPWDQALVIIMRSKKLGYIRQGNVIRISTLEQLQAETTVNKAIIDAQKALEPLRVKVIPVSFSKVEDMVKQVEPFLTPARGKAVSDTRTSSLIITDTDERISRVSALIKDLDIPPAQVMIEGKVVEASETFTQNIGINWSLSGQNQPIGNGVDIRPSLSIRPLSSSVAAGSAGRIGVNIGVMDLLGNLSATLALAEQDSLVKVVSSPRVVTINKEEATITQEGEVIAKATVNNQGTTTTTTSSKPVKLTLKVTPQITNDGSVIMNVDVLRQFAGPIVDEETLARAVNSRSATTKVLVKNGQTAVIGGIYQNDQTSTDTGVPLLKDIPIFGWLFKSKVNERLKNELLIFLTPRILASASDANQVQKN